MTHTFLLEIGIEDMPAHVIQNAENQLIENTKKFFKETNLTFGDVTGYSTPRRFAIIVKELADKQPDQNLLVRGPAKRIAQDEAGNWSKAAIGFSRGQGGTVDDLIIKDEDGEPYVYMDKYIPGEDTGKILQGLGKIVEGIEFPKNMKWGTTSFQYVRPIHWVIALLDSEVIPFEVFSIETGNTTEGHRFLGGPLEINHPNEYETKLEKSYVIPNRSKRKNMIIEQLQSLCAEKNWQMPEADTELLDEVTDLVEYPTVFYGNFDKEYLSVPEAVLETSMIDHQRYFPVREDNEINTLLPYFISVRNGNAEFIDNVARGNEKVLTARLADSKFFFDEDQKSSIEDFSEKLKHVNYHDELGTLYNKQERVTQMVPVLAKNFDLSENETKELTRIASFYKFDLVTQVVDEFPTLQGTIGQLYAEERNEEAAVSKAIGEQYLPRSVSDALPETKLGKFIALMDKLDSLIQFFSVGLIPTGSNDPYALRRQAIGVVRLLLEVENDALELDVFLDELIAVSELPKNRLKDSTSSRIALVDFLRDRLEQMLQSEYKLAHDVRKAALGSTHHNMNWILEVAQQLEAVKDTDTFKATVESITRVLNMTKNVGQSGLVNLDILKTESERMLFEEVTKLEEYVQEKRTAVEFFDALRTISPVINSFYDHNMIMVDDESIKENRLTLLNNLAQIARIFADFSELVI